MWVSVLVRGRLGGGSGRATNWAMDGTDALGARSLEQQQDWERKRRGLHHRHTFYSPRKRETPPPSGQLEPKNPPDPKPIEHPACGAPPLSLKTGQALPGSAEKADLQ